MGENDEAGLDEFPLDEPWNPISYFAEAEEYDLLEEHLPSPPDSKLAELFSTNIEAVQKDFERIESLKNKNKGLEQNTNLVYAEDDDEDNIEKFVTYEDSSDHLKAVDNTFIINQKSIFGDLEKIKRFKQHSIDNGDMFDLPAKDILKDVNKSSNIEDVQEAEIIDDLLKSLPELIVKDPGIDGIPHSDNLYQHGHDNINKGVECNGFSGSLDSSDSVEEVLKAADAIVSAADTTVSGVTSRDLTRGNRDVDEFGRNIPPDSDLMQGHVISADETDSSRSNSFQLHKDNTVAKPDIDLIEPIEADINSENTESYEARFWTSGDNTTNSTTLNQPNTSLHDELMSVSLGFKFDEPSFESTASVANHHHNKITNVEDNEKKSVESNHNKITNVEDNEKKNVESTGEDVDKPESYLSGTESKWSCSICTFINEASDDFCEVCNEPNPIRHQVSNERVYDAVEMLGAVGGWNCPTCTFINNNTSTACELCNGNRTISDSSETDKLETISIENNVKENEQIDNRTLMDDQGRNTTNTNRTESDESEQRRATVQPEYSDDDDDRVTCAELAEICRQVTERQANLVLSDNSHQDSVGTPTPGTIVERDSVTLLEQNFAGDTASPPEVVSTIPRSDTNSTTESEDLEQFINEEMQEPSSSEQGRIEDIQQLLPTQTDAESKLGWFAPKWVPDKDAKICMLCETKFTMVKRRHHCRACGKVLCGNCCNMKFNLPYLSDKPARVCQSCCDILLRAHHSLALSATERSTSHSQDITVGEQSVSLVDSETFSSCSPTSSSNQSVGRGSPPPDYALAAASSRTRGSSGIGTPSLPGYYPTPRGSTPRIRTDSERSAVIMFNSSQTNLPPIIRVQNESLKIINNPDLTTLFQQMHDPDASPVVFLVNKNLVVKLKVVLLDCCVNKKCWCFVSDGMGASNQEEIVLLVEYKGDDVPTLKPVLQQLNAIFEKAKHGDPVSDLGYVTFDNYMLLNTKYSGMIFFKSTCQCIQKITTPSSPHLFGIYTQVYEVPWAKNFPLRLLLRLGYEQKYYPYPLYNVSDRALLYGPVGRTIMNLLADFRNFQYTLPRIVGVTINFTENEIKIKLPHNRYDEVLKTVNTAEENVLAFAGNFTSKVFAHLVCIESEGSYKSQVFRKEDTTGIETGVSFLVFSAALKTSSSGEGQQAKTSIVEDGIMAQVTVDVMKKIRSSIKEMQDYTVQYGDPNDDGIFKKISILWGTSEVLDGQRPTSPIDGTPFENLTNMKIRHSYDFTTNTSPAKIHWMEVYFLPGDADTVNRLSARELSQMTSSVAKACMGALSPHLCTLVELGKTNIGLRINLEPDRVEYKIGSSQELLPEFLNADLDDKLIPAMHGVLTSLPHRKVSAELLFQIAQIV